MTPLNILWKAHLLNDQVVDHFRFDIRRLVLQWWKKYICSRLHVQCVFHISFLKCLTIKLDPARSWQVNLMMCLTNRVYQRRSLSYWFHIICNSLNLPSRPFFIRSVLYVTLSVHNQSDRQTLRRERRREWKGRAEILSLECLCVCECSQLGGCGCEHPKYITPPNSFSYVSSGMCHPNQECMTWLRSVPNNHNWYTIGGQWLKKVKNPTDFFQQLHSMPSSQQ